MTGGELEQVLQRLDNLRDDYRETRLETKAAILQLQNDVRGVMVDFSNFRGRMYGAVAAVAAIVSIVGSAISQYFFR